MSNVQGRQSWKIGKSERIESRQKGSYFSILNLVTCDRKCDVGGILCVCVSQFKQGFWSKCCFFCNLPHAASLAMFGEQRPPMTGQTPTQKDTHKQGPAQLNSCLTRIYTELSLFLSLPLSFMCVCICLLVSLSIDLSCQHLSVVLSISRSFCHFIFLLFCLSFY